MLKLRSHFDKLQGGQFYESHYACAIWYALNVRRIASGICFTLPEFYGGTVTYNDKMIDSMADIQSSSIEKSMRKKHNEGATTLNGPFIDGLRLAYTLHTIHLRNIIVFSNSLNA